MKSIELILYTRSGCCLCEGLEQKLKAIPLKKISPRLQLSIKDIDGKNITAKERVNYSMEVPVLAVKLKPQGQMIELPRVSPRLKKEGLFQWLQKMICEKIEREKSI